MFVYVTPNDILETRFGIVGYSINGENWTFKGDLISYWLSSLSLSKMLWSII